MRTIEVSDDVAALLQQYLGSNSQELTKADLLYAIKKIEDDAKKQQVQNEQKAHSPRASTQQAKVKLLELFLLHQSSDVERVIDLCKTVIIETLNSIKKSNAGKKSNTTFIFGRVLESLISLGDTQFTILQDVRKFVIAYPKMYLSLEKAKRNYHVKDNIYHDICGKSNLGVALKEIIWGSSESAYDNKFITKDEKLAIYKFIEYLLIIINLKNIEVHLIDHLNFVNGLSQLLANKVSKFLRITQRNYKDAYLNSRVPFPNGSGKYLIMTATTAKEMSLVWFQSDEFYSTIAQTRMTYVCVNDDTCISMRLKEITDENRDLILGAIANIASIWHLLPND